MRSKKLAVIIGVAFLLYSLSFGPVARLVDMKDMDDQETTTGQYAFLFVYSPLIFAGVGFRPFGETLKWYQEIWESKSKN